MGKAKIPLKPTTRRDLLAAPIVVTARGAAVAGHARLAVARNRSMEEFPAIVVKHPAIRTRLREEC